MKIHPVEGVCMDLMDHLGFQYVLILSCKRQPITQSFGRKHFSNYEDHESSGCLCRWAHGMFSINLDSLLFGDVHQTQHISFYLFFTFQKWLPRPNHQFVLKCRAEARLRCVKNFHQHSLSSGQTPNIVPQPRCRSELPVTNA